MVVRACRSASNSRQARFSIISLYINNLDGCPLDAGCNFKSTSGELIFRSAMPGPHPEFPDCLYRVPLAARAKIIEEFQDPGVCEFAKT
jgi:hypothetical protein